MMELVGLAKRLEGSYPHELDGGRRQRIGIARALSLNPDFIVCDEPVSALDVSIQAQILNLLQGLQEERGLTYMFITHDMSVVKHISDDIAVMYLGQLIQKCPANEIFRDSESDPYSQASAFPAILIPNVHVKKERIGLDRRARHLRSDPKPCLPFCGTLSICKRGMYGERTGTARSKTKSFCCMSLCGKIYEIERIKI